MKLAVLAERLGAELRPAAGGEGRAAGEVEVTGVAGLEKAGPGEVSFLTNLKYSSAGEDDQGGGVDCGAGGAGVSGGDAAGGESLPGVCAGAGAVSSDPAVGCRACMRRRW